ncbi:restriction endonuclease subunit S [candidate division KSB1 bacterium]|nr:restriction endonuclease subunit S [candidate division KSB1 bacterium]
MKREWIETNVGEIADAIQYGYTASATTQKVGPQFLRITDIQNGKVDWQAVPYCQCDELDKYKLQEGDILFARTGATTGKSFLVKDCPETVFASYLIRVRLKKEILPNYVYQFFQTPAYWNQIKQFTTGSTQGGFNASKLAEIKIPLPPFSIQQQIAAILEKADAAREKRRQANQLTEQFLQSAFLEMFGDPAMNPKGWEKMTMEVVCSKVADGTHFSPPLRESGVPYITAKHLKPHGLNFFKSPTFISQEHHQEIYKRCDPVYGDVLYIKDGATTGITAVNRYSFEFSMLSSLALLKPKKDLITGEYLAAYLNNENIKNSILRHMAGAAIRRLTVEKIKRLPILAPPIALQQKFSALVEKVESLRAKQRQSEQELEHLFNSLMQRAFRGERS